jgi:hypothetical protein
MTKKCTLCYITYIKVLQDSKKMRNFAPKFKNHHINH